MSNQENRRETKGTFGEARLSVSRRYHFPAQRWILIAVGLAVFAAVVGLAAADFLRDEPRLLSNGPLSSNHANLESDCAACHIEPGTVTDEACSSCHEKFGDPVGVFSFAAHNLYRSSDFQRVVPSEHEGACFSCHVEHEGRGADISRVADARCLSCHEFGSFNRDHPPFDATVQWEPDTGGGLHFPHSHHVNELMSKHQWEDVEKTCLTCHEPEADGKTFQALDFDAHCGDCHLQSTLRTAPVAIASQQENGRGVQTLDEIQDEGGPGTRWASFINPNDFRRAGGRLFKSPLYHRDPWILHSLRSLRKELFPDAGLADLLVGSTDVAEADQLVLYQEALGTLREYAVELRSRPEREVQAELEQINELLVELEKRIGAPYAPLDESKFLLALGSPSESLTDEAKSQIDDLVQTLTAACQECHVVEHATIKRVRTDLSAFRRAEFNHRAHILETRCLDCHSQIPITDNLGSSEPLDASVDNAGIWNLPTIEVCQDCHNQRQVESSCTTCHEFHPNKEQRSNLLLYLEGVEGKGSP